MSIPPTVQQLNQLDQYKLLINDIIDIFIICTNWYLIDKQFYLIEEKNKKKINLENVGWGNEPDGSTLLYYVKNNNPFKVSMHISVSGDHFYTYFEGSQNNKSRKFTTTYDKNADMNNHVYINNKIVELFRSYDEKINDFLFDPPPNVPQDVGAVVTDDICISDNIDSGINIILPEHQDRIGIGPLMTPVPKADEDENKDKEE